MQMRLRRIERYLIDQWRHFDGDDLTDGLKRLVLGALVKLVAADIGRPRQDAVNLADAPVPAVAGEDAVLVQIRRDVLDIHRAARAVAFQSEPIDQPDGVGVQRIDFELLLDLRAPLLGRDDAVTDRWQ
ncbi:MAG TPA: hypothetical protein VHC04_11880 [Rhodopila sp.]|nr:hypothetical protein [Rhodopila sp.]HVZ08602.1 hypothetical protein [Rhodopila sp.]